MDIFVIGEDKSLNKTGTVDGNNIAIGASGAAVIGSGDSASGLLPDSDDDKRMIIGADTVIEFYVNCQNGVANAKKVTMSLDGLLSGHQKAISFGTSAPTGGNNGDIYIQI